MSSSTQLFGVTKSQIHRIQPFVVLLLLLAAAEFMIRGPVRYFESRSEWNDFSQNYTASKLWLRGKSPANPANFIALWKEQTNVGLERSDIRTRLAPPLGGLVVMAPVAAFPWKPAKILWMLLLLLSFAATVGMLTRFLRRPWNSNGSLIFVAACLALAPFHTGVANGNTTILVIGLCAIAVWSAMQKHDNGAGILFGIACSIKPQLGAFLVLYYLVRLRWRLFVVAVGCTAVLNAFAVLYLYIKGTPWVDEYVRNATGFVTNNNIDSFASDNLGRFGLINLQVPFFSITRNSQSANLWALAVTIGVLGAWIFLVLRNTQMDELLALGAISTIALLPVYHRAYDAAMLAFPLCWGVVHIAGQMKHFARAGSLLILPFLFPGSAYLQKLALGNKLPYSMTSSSVWESLVMPHESWALLLLCILLLGAMSLTQKSAVKH